jgi:hypothetical protein
MVGLLNQNPYGRGLLNQPLTYAGMYPPSIVNAQNPLPSYSHLGKPMPPDMAPAQIVKGILGGMGNLAMQANEAMPWGGNNPQAIGYDPQAGTIDPSKMIPFATDVAGMATTGSLAAPAVGNGLGMGIRAYHGSPHDFDRFSMDKIGTGEGAQAYGHGLYFAENPKVAESYKFVHGNGVPAPDIIEYRGQEISNLAGIGSAALRPAGAADPGMSDGLRRFPSDGTSANPTIANFGVGATPAKLKNVLPDYTDDQIAALQFLIHTRGDGAKAASLLQAKGRPEAARIAADTAGEFQVKKLNDPDGSKMYEVDINASPDEFLDWDKPLSEQPPKVRAVLEELGIQTGNRGQWTVTPSKTEGKWVLKNAWGEVSGIYKDKAKAESIAAQNTRSHNAGGVGLAYTQLGGNHIYSRAGADRGAASAKLNAAGIKGIRYKDAGSRGADSAGGTSNFVVFDDNIIDILKKYGIAGLAAGGAGAAMLGGGTQDASAAPTSYSTGGRF